MTSKQATKRDTSPPAPVIHLDTDVPLGKPVREVQGLKAHLRALKAAPPLSAEKLAKGDRVSFWYPTEGKWADRTIRSRGNEIGVKVAIRLEPHGEVRGYRVFRVEGVEDGK